MTTTAPPKAPSALYLTDNQASCELIATVPEAFLIGFILDQQVTVQKAFQGPSDLIDRVGTIAPKKLAAMRLDKLEAAFSEKPALHRYPRAMAQRVHEAMQLVVDRYDGDAGKLLFTASDADEMTKRLLEIPGFGKPKAFVVITVLALQFGMPFTGWEDKAPTWGTLGHVDSHEALKRYQHEKNAYKKARRAEGVAEATATAEQAAKAAAQKSTKSTRARATSGSNKS
ncbi:MAG: DNA repair protein [Thermoleophilia bacterium]|nr:DNA repair protein [Thermoleophilia bacterium]